MFTGLEHVRGTSFCSGLDQILLFSGSWRGTRKKVLLIWAAKHDWCKKLYEKNQTKVFLAEVYEAAVFTGRTEILTAGSSGTVLLSME